MSAPAERPPPGIVERAEALVAAMVGAHDPVVAAGLHEDFQRETGYCLLLLGDGVMVAKLPER